MAKLKPAIEIISAIGSLGFNLQFHSADEIEKAMRFMRSANPEMFDWLVTQLSKGKPS